MAAKKAKKSARKTAARKPAPKDKTLNDLFYDQLKDIYFAEKQILKALPKMAKAAQSKDLSAAFKKHLGETQGQVGRLEQIFRLIDKPAEATVARKATGPASLTGERVLRTALAPLPKPQPGRVELAQAAPSAGRKPGATERPRPSFDCGKARSVPEKMICSDAELARVDRELGRVYARAKNSTANSAAFRRQNNAEWRRRESTCRDRECLLRWYAKRSDQLSNDINEASRQTPPTASRQSVL